jgi:hypothetical protein
MLHSSSSRSFVSHQCLSVLSTSKKRKQSLPMVLTFIQSQFIEDRKILQQLFRFTINGKNRGDRGGFLLRRGRGNIVVQRLTWDIFDGKRKSSSRGRVGIGFGYGRSR